MRQLRSRPRWLSVEVVPPGSNSLLVAPMTIFYVRILHSDYPETGSVPVADRVPGAILVVEGDDRHQVGQDRAARLILAVCCSAVPAKRMATMIPRWFWVIWPIALADTGGKPSREVGSNRDRLVVVAHDMRCDDEARRPGDADCAASDCCRRGRAIREPGLAHRQTPIRNHRSLAGSAWWSRMLHIRRDTRAISHVCCP